MVLVVFTHVIQIKEFKMKSTNSKKIDIFNRNNDEIKNRFDNAFDNSWIIPNSFSDWIPSVYFDKYDNHALIINLKQLNKENIDIAFEDGKLIIGNKKISNSNNKTGLTTYIFKRIYNLNGPITARNIQLKFKNGKKYIKSKNEGIQFPVNSIEIKISLLNMNTISSN